MVKCLNCGAENPDYAAFCGRCSADLKESKAKAGSAGYSATDTAAEPTEKPPELKRCMSCGRAVNAMTPICPYCGKNPAGAFASASSIYEPSYEEPEGDFGTRRSSGAAVAGGILSILAGITAAAQGALIATASASVPGVYTPGSGAVCFCGGLDFLFGALAIFGGVAAIKQTGWGIAMLGAILGMLGLGFLIGAVFGLIALILVAVSRADFD